MRAWRICPLERASTAFSGEGAFLYGGRWNSPGLRVVYLGGTPAIAALEMLAHQTSLKVLASMDFVLIPVEFEEVLITDVDRPLPADWRESPAPASTAALGDAWIASERSALLRVPSAVLPLEANYLLNCTHPEADQLKVGTPVGFVFDSRLMWLVERGPVN